MFSVLLRLVFFMTNGRSVLLDVGDMLRTGAAIALNERGDRLLRRGIAMSAVFSFAANEGFVRLDHLAGAAQRAASRVRIDQGHGLTNAVREEPRGLVVCRWFDAVDAPTRLSWNCS